MSYNQCEFRGELIEDGLHNKCFRYGNNRWVACPYGSNESAMEKCRCYSEKKGEFMTYLDLALKVCDGRYTEKDIIEDNCPKDFNLEEHSGNEFCNSMYNGGCYNCWHREVEVNKLVKSDPNPQNDPVNHPSHYTAGGIECIDAIAAALSSHQDPMAAWLTGQCLKYLWRWPLKNGLEDLKKARFYLDRLIKHEEEKNG